MFKGEVYRESRKKDNAGDVVPRKSQRDALLSIEVDGGSGGGKELGKYGSTGVFEKSDGEGVEEMTGV